jgi:hypothetical protein
MAGAGGTGKHVVEELVATQTPTDAIVKLRALVSSTAADAPLQ